MINHWIYRLRHFFKRLWVQASAFAILGVVSALISFPLSRFVPDRFAELVGGDAVYRILNVMASSMLIVVTFSLSTMVNAYSSATNTATPRATSLIIYDQRSHSAISFFLGAFIYSIVSLIAVSTEYYGEKGRVILLLITLLVLSTVVWMIIRWVDDLKSMSSVSETLRRVEQKTIISLENRLKRPTFGCNEFTKPDRATFALLSEKCGHLQNIDVRSLARIASKKELKFYINHEVGAFLHIRSVLVEIAGESISEKIKKEIRECFEIGNQRTFEFDPRYGVTVLSGVGIKALSTSLNDPGTAIDVIGSLVRVLESIDSIQEEHVKEPGFDQIFLPRLSFSDLFHEAFSSLSIEGSRHLSVIKCLQEAMTGLEKMQHPELSHMATRHLAWVNEKEIDF